MEIRTCTCDHNGVTGSTCQQFHPAQPSLCELSQMSLLWTSVSWSAMSSLAKISIAPGKEIHVPPRLYVLGTEIKKMDEF